MNKTSNMSDFEMSLIEIMAHLYKNNAIDDKILDTISGLSFDYQTLLHQSKILEERANIDPKTNLLKYREDYLSMILKSASRTIKVPDRII